MHEEDIVQRNLSRPKHNIPRQRHVVLVWTQFLIERGPFVVPGAVAQQANAVNANWIIGSVIEMALQVVNDPDQTAFPNLKPYHFGLVMLDDHSGYPHLAGPALTRTLARVRRIMVPFVKRRLKRDVASELVPKTSRVVTVDPTPSQRELYDG